MAYVGWTTPLSQHIIMILIHGNFVRSTQVAIHDITLLRPRFLQFQSKGCMYSFGEVLSQSAEPVIILSYSSFPTSDLLSSYHLSQHKVSGYQYGSVVDHMQRKKIAETSSHAKLYPLTNFPGVRILLPSNW